MPLARETRLGPFKVDRQGLLSPSSPNLFPRFAVVWRNRLVQAQMHQPDPTNAKQGTLSLLAQVGRVPSTGGPANISADRGTSLGVLRQLPRLMPKGWSLRVMADHSVVVEADQVLSLPVSAINLVTQMSLFLLALQPYLDVLDDGRIGLIAGIAKT